MNTDPRNTDPQEVGAQFGRDLGAADDTEAREFADTLAELGAAVSAEEPPAHLKSRLLALIAETPQDVPQGLTQNNVPQHARQEAEQDAPHEAEQVTQVSQESTQLPTQQQAPEGNVADIRDHPRWKQPTTWLVGAAAAAVFFVGGIFLGTQVDRNPTTSGQPVETVTLTPSVPAAILDQSDARTVSAEVTGGGSALLVASAGMGKSAIMLSDVPPPEPGKTFQLWYIMGGKATSAGVISLSGTTTQWFDLEGTYQPGMTVGVTVEPAGGSEVPTTTPVVGLNA